MIKAIGNTTISKYPALVKWVAENIPEGRECTRPVSCDFFNHNSCRLLHDIVYGLDTVKGVVYWKLPKCPGRND